MSSVTTTGEMAAILGGPRVRRRRRWATRRSATTVLRYAVIVVVCVVVLFPIYWMFLTAIQPSNDEYTYPPALFFKGYQWSTYSSLFSQNPVASWLLHSAIAAVVCVVVTLALAIPGAYLLSRLRWRGVAPFGFLLLFTQLMPQAMVVVPELQLFRALQLTNNLLALGLLYAAFNVPLGCWILKSSFDTVPPEIVDAALVDGAGRTRVLTSILLPISRPSMVAVLIVAFFGAWNDYLFASAFLSSTDYTGSLGIATLLTSGFVKVDQLAAAGFVFSLLPVLLYVAVQRHVVRGLTAGAVK